jgi:formyltetrahydrofolate deformylase
MAAVYQRLNRIVVMTATEHWVLTFICPDRPGIVHAISGAVLEAGGNITESHQFSSDDTGRFFMRLQIEAAVTQAEFETRVAAIASDFGMAYTLDHVGRRMKTLILASHAAHAVSALLFRQRAGQLPIDVTAVYANHTDLKDWAEFFGVNFHHHSIGGGVDKAQFEREVRATIEREGVELIVLARYMQILSPEFCRDYAGRIINIHHSFLPGFKGANPYAQAHARGVKLIGATAHFVTEDLDEGPIIEQNVTRVEHHDSRSKLVQIGQDIESQTLAEAVRLFAEHRVLLDGIRTIIFR